MPVKKLVGVFTALAIALMTAVISIPSAAASSADAQFANRLYVLINDYRAQHALQPLRWSDSMSANAQSWTQQSADQANVNGAGSFQHSPGSYNFPENIVWNMSADQAFSWWVNSPAHRGNMLRATDTDIGLGAVQLTAGPNRGAYLATAQFGQSALSSEEEAARAAEEARAAEAARLAEDAKAAADKAAADQAAADRAAADQAAADKAAADQVAADKAAADQVAADKAAAEKAAADKAAADKAAADKAAADKAAADAAGKAPEADAGVSAPDSAQAEKDKAAEAAAAQKAAEEKAAAEKAAAEEAAAAEIAAAEKAASDKAAAEKVAAEKAAAEKAAEEAAADKAAEETAANAAAEKAAAEEAAAAQAAAEKAAAEKAAADAAARSAAEQKAQAAAALGQVTLGNESFLTASARGTVAAAAAGSQLRISGLEAAATYEVVLPSAGVNLGAVTAAGNGSLAVSVPSVLGAGEHKVALFKDGVLSGWTTFTVEQAVTVLAAAPAPAAADGTTELAATGLNAAQLSIGGIGALMALTGAAALVALQRQRSTSAR